MSETKKEKAWYVVRAIGGKEHKVKEYLDAEIRRNGLEEQISQVLIPTEKVYTIRNGKAEIPVSYIPPEATATVNPNALLTLPAIMKAGAAYLGIPYRSPGYGYDIYGGSTPVKLSRDKIAGLDCSGFVYSVLMDLGVRTAGFSSRGGWISRRRSLRFAARSS